MKQEPLTRMEPLFSGRYKWAVEIDEEPAISALRLCYDRNFCSASGIDYKNPDLKLIEIGIRRARGME